MASECGGLKPIGVRRVTSSGSNDDDDQEQQPLTPMARVFHEPDVDVYVLLLFSFKTPINIQLFKHLMSPLLQQCPRFSSLIVKDEATQKLHWIPATNVDIDSHVVVPCLDGTTDSPDKVVDDYLSDLSQTGMDVSRPMWEWHVLNLATSDGAESTAVLRLHHSLGDGVSLMSLILSLANKEGSWNSVKQQQERGGGKLLRRCLRWLWLTWLMWWNSLLAGIMFLAMIFLNLKDTETPVKSPYGCGRCRRRFVWKTISLDDVKHVKNALGVTINDVMTAVAQAGLSQYLNRQYSEIGKDVTKKTNNLPKNIRLTALLVMNLRPGHGIPDLNEMMKANSKTKWGNKIGLVPLPFNICLEENPVNYVRKSKASMDRKKRSIEALCSYFLIESILKFGRPIVGNFATKMSLAFSNIAGPQHEITLFGHQVTNIVPSVYGALPLALVIHVGSYWKKMNMVLSVDERVISDPQKLCDDMKESFDLIKQSVTAKIPIIAQIQMDIVASRGESKLNRART